MNANFPAAILSNFDGDYRAAYEYLSKMYIGLQKQFFDSISARFIEISRFEADSEICVRKITEQEISTSVDMADCIDEGFTRKWLYVDDEGEIHPVTIGRQERYSNGVEQPFQFASSSIVAAGKVVGKVLCTDH